MELGFPLWLRVVHYLNIFLMFLLIRSGIQILLDFPRYYFNDHCTPGTEWIKFTRKKVPSDRLWTSTDEALPISSWIALPGGRHSLGIGRHWHFFAAILWSVNGLVYIALLFFTGQWRRLIPTSWDFVPQAWRTFLTYATFHVPSAGEFHPYDALQQSTYALVVFILAPLVILTGLALSPAIGGRFPWYPRLFHGRQSARSLHLLSLAAFLIFIIIHVTLVGIVHFKKAMAHIVLGLENHRGALSIVLGLFALGIVVVVQVGATLWSQHNPRGVQRLTGRFISSFTRFFFYGLRSRQAYRKAEISPYFWTNGYPPVTREWEEAARHNFANYRLEIKGLVERPLSLSREDLRAMPEETNITEHCCIQGWSGIAEWTGVPVRDILARCCPVPGARYLVFHSFQTDEKGREYYELLELTEAYYPQTILSYAMNGEPLSVAHGAPLRLRMETKLGFKMVKWLKSIELVEGYKAMGEGQGGYREDTQFYDIEAQI